MHRLAPTILTVLDVFAAVGYGPNGYWRTLVSWLAAVTLTTVVTW